VSRPLRTNCTQATLSHGSFDPGDCASPHLYAGSRVALRKSFRYYVPTCPPARGSAFMSRFISFGCGSSYIDIRSALYATSSLCCYSVYLKVVIMGRNGFMGNISGIDAFGKVGVYTGCGTCPTSEALIYCLVTRRWRMSRSRPGLELSVSIALPLIIHALG